MGWNTTPVTADSDASRQPHENSPVAARGIAVGIGLLLTLLVTGVAAYHGHQRQAEQFRTAADGAFDTLRDTVERDLERARHLALMIRAGARIDVGDPPAAREPAGDSALEFLAWMEPLGDSDDLRVIPLLSAADGRAVASRVLATGDARNGADTAPRRALDRALDTGELTGTRDVVLFQANGEAAPGFMAFLPVPTQEGVGGVIALGLRMDRIAAVARGERPVTMHIFEGADRNLLLYGPGGTTGVAEQPDAAALEDRLHARREFAVASQRWTVYATPAETPSWLSATTAWPLLGGLLLTAVIAWLVSREQSRVHALAGDLGRTRNRLDHLQRDYAVASEILERETVARTTAEQCLQLLESNASDLVLRLSATRTILAASPAVETLLGYTPRSLVGRELDSLLAADAGRSTHHDGQPGDGNEAEPVFTLVDTEGGEHRLEGRFIALPAGMSNAEAELLILHRPRATRPPRDRAPEAPFRAAFDQASTGMALFHPDTGHCLYVNQALCDTLGYAQDELLHMTYHELTHPADQHATREQLETIRNASGDGFRLEKRYLHKTGRVLWVEVNCSLLRDADGQEQYITSQIRDITEQKETERALQRINHRHDLILNAATEAIFGLDTRGRVVFANAAACHLLSREPATIEGQPLGALLRRDDEPPLDDWPLQACLEGRELKHEEGAIFRRGDGTPFPADYTVSPMVDDGRVTGAVVVMADASERQEGEARFRSAFEDVAVGMALIGLDGRFLRANRALCGLVGYDARELLAMHSSDLLYPDDRDANYRTNRLLLDGNRTTGPVEQRLRHRDGGVVWALTSTSLVRDPGGEPRYLLKQAQDITPRKVAEAALRTSEARFRGVFEQAAVGMALLEGQQAAVQRVNGALRELLQCDPDTLSERPFADLVHPVDRDAVLEALASPARARTRSLEVRLTGCGGGQSPTRLRLARIDDVTQGGEPLHLVQIEPDDGEQA